MNIYWCFEKSDYFGLYVIAETRGQAKRIYADEVTERFIDIRCHKKPKKKEENQYSAFYDCPCCGGYLVSKIDGELCGGQEYKYCCRCGQAVDRSDTE